MLTLFTRYVTPEKNYALKLYPEWRYINEKLKDNIRGAVFYLRSTNVRAETLNNPLYKVLFSHCPDISLDDLTFIQNSIYSLEQADSFYRLVALNNNGKDYKNILYKGCQEVFVANNDESRSIEAAYSDDEWKALQPLRLLYTTNTEMDLCLYNNKKLMNNLNVYEINLIELLFQYKKWATFRLINYSSIDPAIYLQQYCYPNMIMDLANLTIFNRLMFYLENNYFPPKNVTKYYPFFIVDVSDKIDSVMERFVKDFKNRKTDITTLINSIPTCHFEKDLGMLHYLRVNVNEISKNSNWVPYVTRFKYLELIYGLLGEEGLKYNKRNLTEFQNEVKMLYNGMISIPKYVDPYTVSEVYESVDNLKSGLLNGTTFKIR